jgi:hypothetical protein
MRGQQVQYVRRTDLELHQDDLLEQLRCGGVVRAHPHRPGRPWRRDGAAEGNEVTNQASSEPSQDEQAMMPVQCRACPPQRRIAAKRLQGETSMRSKLTGFLKIAGLLLGGALLFSAPASAAPKSATPKKGTTIVCPGKGCSCKKATFCDVHPDGTEFNCHEGTYCTVTATRKNYVFPTSGIRNIKIPTATVSGKMR